MTRAILLALSVSVLTLGACSEPETPNETPPVTSPPAPDIITEVTTKPEPVAEPTPVAKTSGLKTKVGWGQLTPEKLHADPSLDGPTLKGVKISPDGSFATVLQGRDDDAAQQDLWAYDLETGQGRLLVSSTDLLGAPEELSAEEKNRRERAREYGKGIVSYEWVGENTLLFPLGGDIYAYDLTKNEATRVTETDGFETDAKVSESGRYVSYVRDNNLFVTDLRNKKETQLTEDATNLIRNATASFVVQEELDRDTGYWWAPDNESLAYTQIDETNIAIENRIEFGADSIENVSQRYPFAGTVNARVRLGVVPRKGGETVWADLGENTDIYVTRVFWAKDGKTLYAGILSRDHKTHTVLKIKPEDGTSETLFEDISPTWLNIYGDFEPLNDGTTLWSNETSGVRQVYRIDAEGALTAITPSDSLVNKVNCISEESETLYFTGWKDNALESHVFSVNFDGTGLTQLSTGEGRHKAEFSENCERYIGTFSGVSTPPQTRAFSNTGEPLTWLNENALGGEHPYQKHVNSHVVPAYGQIAASDGTLMDYELYTPANLKDGEQRPVITIVYGGPGVQRVHKGWERKLFQQMLVDHGFIVFQLDNRGATNRGKSFEDPLYRAMGKTEVEDQIAGAEWLKNQPFTDAAHMGIYGWSYGGYMTLHMLAQTDLYRSGVSGAPVTDWRLYDTAYTERYLGDPNPESPNYTTGAYEDGSVFEHVDGLTEPFLLIHGMADDNVVFRHSIKLMNDMQAEGRQNMRIMTYPGEKHGFRKTENKIHRDRQILNFFLETLGN